MELSMPLIAGHPDQEKGISRNISSTLFVPSIVLCIMYLFIGAMSENALADSWSCIRDCGYCKDRFQIVSGTACGGFTDDCFAKYGECISPNWYGFGNCDWKITAQVSACIAAKHPSEHVCAWLFRRCKPEGDGDCDKGTVNYCLQLYGPSPRLSQ